VSCCASMPLSADSVGIVGELCVWIRFWYHVVHATALQRTTSRITHSSFRPPASSLRVSPASYPRRQRSLQPLKLSRLLWSPHQLSPAYRSVVVCETCARVLMFMVSLVLCLFVGLVLLVLLVVVVRDVLSVCHRQRDSVLRFSRLL